MVLDGWQKWALVGLCIGLVVGGLLFYLWARGRYSYGGKDLPKETMLCTGGKHTLVYVDDYELAWLDKRRPGGKKFIIDGEDTGINCYPPTKKGIPGLQHPRHKNTIAKRLDWRTIHHNAIFEARRLEQLSGFVLYPHGIRYQGHRNPRFNEENMTEEERRAKEESDILYDDAERIEEKVMVENWDNDN